MKNKLEKLVKRYDELTDLLSKQEVLSNQQLIKKYSVERKELQDIIEKFRTFLRLEKELKGASDLLMSDDPEMKKLAEKEIEALTEEKEKALKDIKLSLLPRDPMDGKNIIMEIRAGVGGDEAALFVAALYKMYTIYAEKKGWKVEIMDARPTDIGGFKEIIFSISGRNAYKRFKYESGVHRVQRVPETEASGRIHTSTVTVAVLPEAETVDLEESINPEDLRIDVYHASGHGGQNVQKVATAIRILHKPTGIMVTCQDERSQLQNKIKAMRILYARLYDFFQSQKDQEMIEKRRSQVGRGNRNERIRTYNFPQGRVTDHRINFSLYNLPSILEGEMDELLDKLIEEDEREQLKLLETKE
ncbi:MAG: peptide chain release factor 1 [Caldisericota bacterium]|nr:peptide chain release factor 1 [Caldisericota bacterium]